MDIYEYIVVFIEKDIYVFINLVYSIIVSKDDNIRNKI